MYIQTKVYDDWGQHHFEADKAEWKYRATCFKTLGLATHLTLSNLEISSITSPPSLYIYKPMNQPGHLSESISEQRGEDRTTRVLAITSKSRASKLKCIMGQNKVS